MLHPEDVRLALRQLPDELDGVYSIIVGQIHNGSAWSMPLAKKALRWMLHAQQALGSHELIKALSADSDASRSSVTVDLLLNICCNLVMYDSELDVVRFVHLSVREYLEQGQEEYEMCLSHASIAVACLQSCLHGSKPKRKVQLRNSQNKTFYDYAMVYWPLHCANSGKYRLEGQLSKLFMSFLYDGKRTSRYYRDWIINWPDSWEEMELGGILIYDLSYPLRERILDGQSAAWWGPIFLACSFGFLEILKSSERFSDRDIRRTNRSGRDPFTVAVRHGEGEVVEHLASMASGAGESDEASLIAAVTMSRAPLVQYLLENNEKLEITEDILRMAIRSADITTIKLILEHERCEKPDITTDLLASAAANEISGKDATDLLMGLDEFLEIDEEVVITACKNRNQGLKIIERLFAYQENVPISEDAAEAAASNSTCGWGLLRFLFKRAPNLLVTDFMFESAAGCFSAKPIRFLLAQSTSVSPKYNCLCIAAENVEVGDEIMELLLQRCDSTLLDSSLLLLVLENSKRAASLLRLLLGKTADTPIQVTTEALVLACKNKYGQELMEELLPRYLPSTIDLRVALVAAGNQYSPVELLTLISHRDESLVLSIDVAIAAAKNAQYALELLSCIHQHKNDVFTIPEVVEAYVANWTSGLEIVQHAKDTGYLIASSKALEFAVQNNRHGDKIIGQWFRNKIHVEISPKAVESVMFNHLGPEILRLFWRMDGNVQVSQKGIEFAAQNMTAGPQLLKMIIKHQGIPKDLESVVWFATQNRESGIEVIEVLSSAAPLCLTGSGLEAALAAHYVETNERINHLLRDQTIDMVVTNDAVRWATETDDCLPTLSLLLRRKPDSEITTDSICIAIKRCCSITTLGELFEFFTSIGRPIEVTETIMKACFKSGLPHMKSIDFLEQYCRQAESSLPVTTEVIYIIMNTQKWDSRRFKVLERLLKIDMKDRKSALSINKDIVKLALPDWQAEKFFTAMKKYNKPMPNSVRSDPDCICLGVANLYLKDNSVQEIFGIDSKTRKSLRGTESSLITMIKITDSIRCLKTALLGLDDPLPITPKVLKAAIQRRSWPDLHLALLVKLLIKQQPSRVPEVINEEVLLLVTSIKVWTPTRMLKLLFRIRRQFNAPIPISSRLIDLSARANFLVCQFLMREFSNENGIDSLRALVSSHTVKQALRCVSFPASIRELENLMGRKHLNSLFDEEALMKASAPGYTSSYNREAIFKVITPLHSLDFYEGISELMKISHTGNLITLRRLLAKGAFLNAQDGTGLTTLSRACFRGVLSVVKELLKHPSVELNTADQEGMTALMIVAKTDRAGAVRELLEHGAYKTLLDNKGRTAEDIARLNGHYALATYIREFGNTSADPAVAEVGLPDRFPTSPLTLLTRTTM